MRASRGFTLIELVVALGVAGIATATMLGIFVSQQTAMQSQERAREVQDNARTAQVMMERTLRHAGFGVEPPIAFDFESYPALPCTSPPCLRDRVDAPDKLVFYARNPRYGMLGGLPVGRAWAYMGASGNLQLMAREGDHFARGQVLAVVCDGATSVAYVTVNATVTVESAGEVNLALQPAPGTTGSPENRFHQQEMLGTVPCFATGVGGGTLIFQVDRYHYFIHEFANANGEVTPWLMLDTGIDENGDGQVTELDWLPVAEGVEDLQVEYLMNVSDTDTAPDEDEDWVYGNTPGLFEQPDVLAAAPQYTDPMRSPLRFSGHPANIRAVRFHLQLRTTRAGGAEQPGDAPEARGNRTAASLGEPGAFRRMTVSSTVQTPNMQSRARFRF